MNHIKRNNAALTLFWDLNGRNHEITFNNFEKMYILVIRMIVKIILL
jgi:hypothetical protein